VTIIPFPEKMFVLWSRTLQLPAAVPFWFGSAKMTGGAGRMPQSKWIIDGSLFNICDTISCDLLVAPTLMGEAENLSA
jgi:hypothetical protein